MTSPRAHGPQGNAVALRGLPLPDFTAAVEDDVIAFDAAGNLVLTQRVDAAQKVDSIVLDIANCDVRMFRSAANTVAWDDNAAGTPRLEYDASLGTLEATGITTGGVVHFHLEGDLNANLNAFVENESSGTAALAVIRALNDVGNDINIACYGSGHATNPSLSFLGTNQELHILTGLDHPIIFETFNVDRWEIQNNTDGGHLIPSVDDAYNFGSASLRPSTVYVATSMVVGDEGATFQILGTAATTAATAGAAIQIISGQGFTSSSGALFQAKGGVGGMSGGGQPGGEAILQGGDGGGANGDGGDGRVSGGIAVGSGDGGNALIRGGEATGSGTDGDVLLGDLTTTAVSICHAGAAVQLAFHGATPVAQQTVTGSRGGNAALASLLTALDTLGLIVDSTTA